MITAFTANINSTRFEIPRDFFRKYEKEHKIIERGDIFIISIDKQKLIANIHISNDGGNLRKRMLIRTPPDYKFFNKSKVKILLHVKEKERKIDLNNNLIKNNNGFLIDLYKTIPKSKNLNILTQNNKITLFKKNSNKIITINRFVDYYKLLEILGLYQGEGLRNTKYLNKIQFPNSNQILLNKFLNFFDKIGIPRSSWKVSIALTGEITEKRKTKALKYWSSILKISEANFRKFSNTKTSGKLTSEVGTAVVTYDSSALAFTLLSLLGGIHLIVKKREDYWVFINGLLEADGSVSIKTNGDLSELLLAYDTLEEARFYESIISKLKFSTKIDKKRRVVCIEKDLETKDKWVTWYKFFKNNIFKDHTKRRFKLVNGFLRHQRTKFIYNHLKLLKTKEVVTTKEIMDFLGNTRRNIILAMNRLSELGFIKIKISKNKKPKYLYSLTNKGKEFIELVTSAKIN